MRDLDTEPAQSEPPLRAIRAGQGHPILLLPGFGVSPVSYSRPIDCLAERFLVIAPWLETRGGWAFSRVVAAIESTLDAHRVDSVTIVGHSFGGAFALAAAARVPDRVDSLVLVNSMGRSPGFMNMAKLGLNPVNVRNLSFVTARDIFGAAIRDPRFLVSSAWCACRCDLVDEIGLVREAGIPAAVLWSRGDSLLPLRLGRALAESLGVPFHEVSGMRPGTELNHDWPLRQPRRFAEEISMVLRDLGAKSSTVVRRANAGPADAECLAP